MDDEIPGLTYLKMLCNEIRELEVVKAYTDPEKFINDIPALEFDLCILDIEMPRFNGIQVASMLKDKFVIFVTAYREYAADAFNLDAVDFVQKPVTKERLHSAIRKAIAPRSLRMQPAEPVYLNTDKGKTLLQTDKLAYVTTSEVDSRDKVAVMLDGSSMVLKNISFKTLQTQLLPSATFCQVNKKQVIALKIVASFTFDEITTTVPSGDTSLKLPLSETYRPQFHQAIKGIS